MLGAAFLALVQDDIKRVLAYSTLSQLAYMVAALSVGEAGATPAFFHLFTHAFFKALLFLGAGSVIHAVHSNNMSDMGGLRKHMPITFWTFVIGSAALAGILPLAGFWSKDELLVVTQEDTTWLFVVLLRVAVLTAFYMTRMVVLTFFGAYRGPRPSARVAGPMTGPLVVLAAGRSASGSWGAAVQAVLQVGVLRAPRGDGLRGVDRALGTVAALAGIVHRPGALRGSERARPAHDGSGPRGTCWSTGTTWTSST